MTVKQAGRNIIMAIVENGAQIIQLTLATNALGVGIILLEPAGTSFNASPSWRWMSQHGTEQQWAALCLFIALIGFYGVVAPAALVARRIIFRHEHLYRRSVDIVLHQRAQPHRLVHLRPVHSLVVLAVLVSHLPGMTVIRDKLTELRLWILLHEPWWIEIFSGLTALSWGIYATFDRIDLAEYAAFSDVADFLPSWFFAYWAILAGLVQTVSALLHRRNLRVVCALLLMLFWMVFAVSIVKSSAPGPGWITYAGWACANMAAFVRLAFR